MHRNSVRYSSLAVLALAMMSGAFGLAQSTTKEAPSSVDRNSAGDSPGDPGPAASDVSPAITHAAVRYVASKVATWQIAHSESVFNRQWTFAALYDGLLATSALTGDPQFKQAVIRLAEKSDWNLINDRFPHADDMALGKAYLDLYAEDKVSLHMQDTRAILDKLVMRQDDPSKLLWWWCDALYMAPRVLARMADLTGDRRYLDYMDKEWWETSASLYSPQYHLFFRDSRFFTQHEANGKPVFWGRGNGWVMGAFVKVLQVMPTDYPSRPKYIAQYKQMADEIASLQQADGLWRTGLLDQAAYELPEISGSAFFTYSLAWGVNQGILDRRKFAPVVRRSWAGEVSHIYADGRLGSIQPIGAEPGKFQLSSSYVYGVGSFLLAASEVDKMARK
jgi:unsaturated rhamnogalacturonyl hydrolase